MLLRAQWLEMNLPLNEFQESRVIELGAFLTFRCDNVHLNCRVAPRVESLCGMDALNHNEY